MNDQYKYGLDGTLPHPISEYDLAVTNEIANIADQRIAVGNPLPVRLAKAEVRCNQLRWQDNMPCDWNVWFSAKSDEIEGMAKQRIYRHLAKEHTGLEYRARATITTVQDLSG